MVKGYALLIILLMFPLASANTLNLHTDDNVSFSGLLATISFTEENTKVEQALYVNQNNTLSLADNITGSLHLIITKDHIYSGQMDLSTGNTIILKPTAKISGYVLDEKNNLLQHAPLRIVCDDTIGDMPEETDEAGFFSLQDVGFGNCEIGAINNNKLFTYQLTVDESKHYLIKIVTTSEGRSSSVLAWAVVILVIAASAYYIVRKRPKRTHTKRQEDLYATLSEQEKLIVDQLFTKGALTQSQLRHHTGLPKSTLHRTLAKLEQKNITMQQEDAGIKRTQFTDFFKK